MPQRACTALKVVPPDPWAGDAQKGRDMIAGIFRFAGQAIEKNELSWLPEKARPEWVAELHGFEWLRDLRSVGGDKARRMAREMVGNWLEVYEKPCPVAWAADVAGTRICSWISFHDFFCASADDEFRRQYFASLQKQGRYLAKMLPGELFGIPLMKALKGLAYSGIALEDGEGRTERAFRIILQQLREQILPDGSHISRNPQATFEVLQCLVDLRTALTAARLEMPEELQHAIDRLAPAVKFFRHGDGAFCQFNGAQEGNPNICDATLMHSGAKGRAMKSLPHSGYEKIQMGRASAIMDVGLPLSAKYGERIHAGLLGFEYSYGKDRVFVNCGSSEFSGIWRNLLRATAAHSTLVVDNRNSCQFNASGAMINQPDVRCRRQEDDDIAAIEASHGGYMPRFGLTHRRCLRLYDGGDVLLGEDTLTGKSGVPFAVRFHLHPTIQASIVGDGETVLLRARSGLGWNFTAAGARLEIEESIYAGQGTEPRQTLQIALHGMTSSQATHITWGLRREKI